MRSLFISLSLIAILCSCSLAGTMSSLPEDTTPEGTDWLIIDHASVVPNTRKASISNVVSLNETDPQVGSVTNGNFCKGTGTQVSCTDSTTYLASSTIGTLTNGKLCTTNGSIISCTENPATGSVVYRGTLDASGGVYPEGPAQGDYYIVTVAGTIDGTAFLVGDWAVYNGSDWDKVDNSASSSGWTVGDDAVQLVDIDADVGIGTETPSTKLEVVGTITATAFAGDLTGDVTGNADTASAATALAANGANCSAGEYPLGVGADGAVEDCTDATTEISSLIGTHAAVTSTHGATALNTADRIVIRNSSGNFAAGTITASLTGNASTATALASNPSDCAANQFATSIDASGNLTCSTPPGSISGLTTNYITKASSATAIANSQIFDNGTNVGIGDATPSTKLEVNGTVTATAFAGPLTGDVTGTASALAANGTNCASGTYPLGVDAAGNAESCEAVDVIDLSALDQGIYFADDGVYDIGTALASIKDIHIDGAIYLYGEGTNEFGSDIEVDGNVYATEFWGDGSNLTGLPSSSQWTTVATGIEFVDENIYTGYDWAGSFPQVQFSVRALANSASKVLIGGYNAAGSPVFTVYSNASGNGEMRFRNSAGNTDSAFNSGWHSYVSANSTSYYFGVGNNNPSFKLDVTGEARVTGISGDGTGKAVCIKSDGALGTCADAVGAGGTCTCG